MTVTVSHFFHTERLKYEIMKTKCNLDLRNNQENQQKYLIKKIRDNLTMISR